MATQGGMPPNRILEYLEQTRAKEQREDASGLPPHLSGQVPPSPPARPSPVPNGSDDPNAMPDAIVHSRAILKNMGAVERMDGSMWLTYPKPHGVLYEVRPIGIKDGLRLSKIRATLNDVYIDVNENGETEENTRRFLAAAVEAAHLFKRLVRPDSRVLRWFVYWLPWFKPFDHITAAELSEFLDFFSSCQILSRVQLHGLLHPRAEK
jgi:hypothetical protein